MTDGEIYPRDMIGYGRTPPFADWPNNARLAVQFVINYEEGGENNILHGDAASEAFLSEIVGAAPWPGLRHMNMELIYEYGSRAGFWRLHRLFTERSAPVTVYAVATAMARNPEAVAAMNEAGWEIATHGLKWIDYRDIPPEVEARHIAEAVRIHAEVAGARPLGFYQGRSSVNTIRLGMEEGGFVYCADTYADDLPYWLDGPRGPQLMTPYTLDSNDMRFATPQGFNSGEQFYAYLKIPSTRSTPKATSRRKCCRSACIAASSAARDAPPRSQGSSTMSGATIGSGFRPGSTSPVTGSGNIRRRAAGSPRASPAPCSSSGSAEFTSIRPDRGQGLRQRPDQRGRYGRGIGEGARRRCGEGDGGRKAGADQGPSGSGR